MTRSEQAAKAGYEMMLRWTGIDADAAINRWENQPQKLRDDWKETALEILAVGCPKQEAVANLVSAAKLMRVWLRLEGGFEMAIEDKGIDAVIAALDEK